MRLMIAIIAVVLGLRCAQAGDSQAALAPPSPLPPAADRPFVCRDFRNRPVRTVEVTELGDAGRAEFIEGNPIILLDPNLMGTLPASLQTFFKLHECAHHQLGHLFAPNSSSEKEADCWAIKEGRKRSIYAAADIEGWKPYFANSLGSKMGHLPGPQRIEFLLGCFGEP